VVKTCNRQQATVTHRFGSTMASYLMTKPKKPGWEINMRHAGNVVMAVPLAVSTALIVWKLSFWRLISSTVGLIFFAVTTLVFAVVFYSILEWYWNRPDELAKRLPISSKELRRKTKQYNDNLPK
jgi:hypothetical protein